MARTGRAHRRLAPRRCMSSMPTLVNSERPFPFLAGTLALSAKSGKTWADSGLFPAYSQLIRRLFKARERLIAASADAFMGVVAHIVQHKIFSLAGLDSAADRSNISAFPGIKIKRKNKII